VIYFSSNVFRSAGVTSDVLASAGVGLVNVIATLVAGSVIDKLGRKPLLIGSFTGMAASMLLLAVRVKTEKRKNEKNEGPYGPVGRYHGLRRTKVGLWIPRTGGVVLAH
jgi:MFS family permease